MFYSPSTNGFYDSAASGANVPGDAVRITRSEHRALLSGQSSGKRIVADSSGRPVLADRPGPTVEQIAARIPELRYAEESKGVTVNGVRYAGDESNRQALREAVEFMEDAGATEFPTWKDSDGQYHAGHPLADVKGAYRAIGQRRSHLIGLEGQYVAQALAGELTDLDGLDWA